MRRVSQAGLTGVAMLAGLAALVSGTAFAYFTTSGAGSAAAGVSMLEAPTITTATPAVPNALALSWTAVAPPGPGAVTYTVSRDGGKAAGGCAPVLTATTCTDASLALGSYSYVVTAKWRSWTASSAVKTAQVAVGAADHLVLTAASPTPTAGAGDNLTIVAKDASDNTVTSYAGAHSLTFSGAAASPSGSKPTVSNNSSSGTAIAFGSATAITFTAGVATVSGAKNGVMKLYKSGETEIDASDGSIATETPLVLDVESATATKLVLQAETSTPVAGASDNLTTTAQDTYGNTAASYAGTHKLTFSGASASPNGTLPTVSAANGADVAFGTATAIDFDEGVATVSGANNGAMKLSKSGSAKVKATDGSFSATVSVTVASAEAAQFSLAAASTTPVAAANDNLTTTALDPYGNTATGYTGLHELVFSGSSASPSGVLPTVLSYENTAVGFGSPTPINFSAGIAKVASSKNGVMKLTMAGAASIVASEGAISTPAPLAVTVSPGAAARWALANASASAGTLGSACLFACTLTGLGSSSFTVTSKIVVTDTVGNTSNAIGSGHAAKVTASGTGTIGGIPLAIPATGAAESATTFTYSSKSSANFSETITVLASTGTAYTQATLAASK